MEDDELVITVKNRLTELWANIRIHERCVPLGSGDPGDGELWSAAGERLREDFVAAVRRAVTSGLDAFTIAEAAGCDVYDIVSDLNEAGLRLPNFDTWPTWQQDPQTLDVQTALRLAWLNLYAHSLNLPHPTDTGELARDQIAAHSQAEHAFQQACRQTARMQIAVGPLCTAAGCTYDQALPHLLAIGYTQNYRQDSDGPTVTISIGEPVPVN